MEREFKPGDVVRVVANAGWGDVKTGDLGTVIRSEMLVDVHLWSVGLAYSVYPTRLEKVDDSEVQARRRG